jgi:tetratricopeptide (TPR) repeat protein
MSNAQSAATARTFLDAGIAASQGNDSTRALGLFAQASEALPGWALPHFLSGSEYAALGQWEKAEAELANAVLLAPDLHLARYQLGLLQFSTGRAAVALVTWERLAGNPEEPSLSAFVRGFAALAQDAFPEALASFERGLAEPRVNPAVAGDIRKVVQKLLAEVPSVTVTEAAPVDAHVLVANYARLKLH